MFKFLYTLRFFKKGSKANPVFHILLYYRSRFVSNLGCIDWGSRKAIIYFNNFLYYYFAGFRIRKYHRYLDIFHILVLGQSKVNPSLFVQSTISNNNTQFIMPKSLFTPKRHHFFRSTLSCKRFRTLL